jgi:hypothetical protein
MSILLNEGYHPGAFIITEGHGHISRENTTIVANAAVAVGDILYKTAPGVYSPLAAGVTLASTDAAAIAIYPKLAADTDRGISVIVRHAEVNSHVVNWPAGQTIGDHAAAVALFAESMVIFR